MEAGLKFGFRKPSIKKRIAARTSVKRYVRHNLGLKAPRGMGWVTNPRRAAYNRVYNRTRKSCFGIFILALLLNLLAIIDVNWARAQISTSLFLPMIVRHVSQTAIPTLIWFPDFVISPGQTCRVYSNENHPEWCSFSYGSGSAIWNNSGDTATLKDGQGNLIDIYPY